MSQLTIERLDTPKPEDEGLTLQQIHWLPVFVPLSALLLALVGLVVLSMA